MTLGKEATGFFPYVGNSTQRRRFDSPMPNPPDEPRTWDETDPDQAVRDLRLSLNTLKDKVDELRRALTGEPAEEDRAE